MTDPERIYTPKRAQTEGLPMFDAEVVAVPTREIRGMVRGNDGIESQHAAVTAKSKATTIQLQVWDILANRGPMTAREVEQLPEFAHLGPSTVRKRISELKAALAVKQVGRKDGMALWDVT